MHLALMLKVMGFSRRRKLEIFCICNACQIVIKITLLANVWLIRSFFYDLLYIYVITVALILGFLFFH
jgi:hypothetical protein